MLSASALPIRVIWKWRFVRLGRAKRIFQKSVFLVGHFVVLRQLVYSEFFFVLSTACISSICVLAC